jgi:hypothetical protein
VLAELTDFDFTRTLCPLSGYEELVVACRNDDGSNGTRPLPPAS